MTTPASNASLPAPRLTQAIGVATDGLPALPLVTDPPPGVAVEQPPRAPDAPVLPSSEVARFLATALVEGVVVGATSTAAERRPSPRWSPRSCSAPSPNPTTTSPPGAGPRWSWALIALSLLSQSVVPSVPVLRGTLSLATLPVVEAHSAVALGLVPLAARRWNPSSSEEPHGR